MSLQGLEHLENDYELAEYLALTLIGHATNDRCGGSDQDYKRLREHFLENPATKDLVPSFIRTNRNTNEFWTFIKNRLPTYAERREFVWSEMQRLLASCDAKRASRVRDSITEVLVSFDPDGINGAWQRALERKASDPEGAITLSRTMLESVCKHILDKQNIPYDANKIELSELYGLTANSLNLSPSQHAERIFKQILGGCSGIINGLGSLRNKLGDAHGKGRGQVKPAARHAALAVNLAGSVAMFLVETFLARSDMRRS